MNTAGRRLVPALLFALAVPALVWAYAPTFVDLANRWASDPQYSHGYLVPGFAALLLWLRRDRLAGQALAMSWWGLPLVVIGLGTRLVGGYYHYVWLDPVSLLPTLAGLWLLAGGRAAFVWAWPSVLFLFFMIPLPYRLSVAMASPLQRLATLVSTYALQTLGLPAVAEGNVILLDNAEIGVVEACSGLRMLVIFFALSSGVALLMRRPLWERLVVLASATPIALAINVVRITATGVLHETAGSRIANLVFHDLAGWLMMPAALVVLAIELQFLKRVWTRPLAA